jgi:Zn-dependent M16 (insulinase) family peptidase
MAGASLKNYEDYAPLQVLGDLMTFTYLIPSIREKGGAYGAGCSVNESGTFSFYSYRDPKIESTYENFEKALG